MEKQTGIRENAQEILRKPEAWETDFSPLRERLLEEIGEDGDEEIRRKIDRLVLGRARERNYRLRDKTALARALFYSVRRLDVLQELLDDPEVTEIMVNGPDRIFVEKEGRITLWEKRFASREKLEDVIRQIVGACNRVINERQPIADARLPDGSRVNAVVAPAALNGPILTIRKFPEEPITLERLCALKSLTEEASELLRRLAEAKYSMMISGGTSAGKTTFLNALSACIPDAERIITIEDNAELQLLGIPNLVRLEAKTANLEENRQITIRDLIRAALRMRPDRIIVGEVRGEEAVDLLQAMNTGHDGSLCTIHANSAADSLRRLETMTMMGLNLPLEAIRRQILTGVDLCVHLGRLADGSRRVLEISELAETGQCEIAMNPLFRWEIAKNRLVRTGELKDVRKLCRAGGSG